MTITTAQIQGAIRWFLAMIAGGALTKGLTSDQFSSMVSNVSTLLGAVVSIATLLWSWWSNHKSQLASQLSQSKSSNLAGKG